MRHASRAAAALCLFLAGLSAAHADGPQPVVKSYTVSFGSQPPPASSRLKYRQGPVCMCSGGLSEADISAAQSPPQPSTAAAADSAEPTHDATRGETP